jgi:hypothetical protein
MEPKARLVEKSLLVGYRVEIFGGVLLHVSKQSPQIILNYCLFSEFFLVV